MKKLDVRNMSKIQGGQVTNCDEFGEVLSWLLDNGHIEQHNLVNELYGDQYCG